jgi:hypothetical protein
MLLPAAARHTPLTSLAKIDRPDVHQSHAGPDNPGNEVLKMSADSLRQCRWCKQDKDPDDFPWNVRYTKHVCTDCVNTRRAARRWAKLHGQEPPPLPRELQPCGTPGAYQQHILRGESACEPCRLANREYKNAWQRQYQQRPEPRARRLAKYRKWRTGLTPEEFQTMLAAQGNRCAICGSPKPGGTGIWHIDHDHSCCAGKRCCGRCIRGILCMLCNNGLGLFRDNPRLLVSALDYLAWSSPG